MHRCGVPLDVVADRIPFDQYRVWGDIRLTSSLTSVQEMRRTLIPGLCIAALMVGPFACVTTAVHGATTTTSTSTSLPALCDPSAPSTSALPGLGCVAPTLPTVTTTSSSTLPSAVTTVPEGCPLPPTAQAVFVGTVTATTTSTATFAVTQVRAGSLDGYLSADSVEVRYGNDAKYLDRGAAYIVGAAQDPVTMKLASTVRDGAELFGGAQVAGSNVACPEFEAVARTLHLDGSSIDSGIFVRFWDQPWRVVLALLFPPLLVLMSLLGVVWYRRGLRA